MTLPTSRWSGKIGVGTPSSHFLVDLAPADVERLAFRFAPGLHAERSSLRRETGLGGEEFLLQAGRAGAERYRVDGIQQRLIDRSLHGRMPYLGRSVYSHVHGRPLLRIRLRFQTDTRQRTPNCSSECWADLTHSGVAAGRPSS